MAKFELTDFLTLSYFQQRSLRGVVESKSSKVTPIRSNHLTRSIELVDELLYLKNYGIENLAMYVQEISFKGSWQKKYNRM